MFFRYAWLGLALAGLAGVVKYVRGLWLGFLLTAVISQSSFLSLSTLLMTFLLPSCLDKTKSRERDTVLSARQRPIRNTTTASNDDEKWSLNSLKSSWLKAVSIYLYSFQLADFRMADEIVSQHPTDWNKKRQRSTTGSGSVSKTERKTFRKLIGKRRLKWESVEFSWPCRLFTEPVAARKEARQWRTGKVTWLP